MLRLENPNFDGKFNGSENSDCKYLFLYNISNEVYCIIDIKSRMVYFDEYSICH